MTNQNEAQIIARIEDLRADLALNFKQICELLVQVKSHYLHRDPAFRWYREVASEKLLPELVIVMQSRRACLEHMIGRPREVQMAVARGGELTWCYARNGEIVERRTPWKNMADKDFKRMFPKGSPVRSLTEQRAVLEQEMAAETPAFIRGQPLARVDAAAQTFILGRQKVPLSVVLAALREVGMQVVERGHLMLTRVNPSTGAPPETEVRFGEGVEGVETSEYVDENGTKLIDITISRTLGGEPRPGGAT